MSFKRIVLGLALLLVSVGWSLTTQAATYSLVGGGGQIHIGGGLPLPIQPVSPLGTGPVFPPLGIPAATGVTIKGTTAMTVQQKITVPASALLKVPAPTTLGVFTSNPTLYAVKTNLGFAWPAAPAMFSTGARTGAKTVLFLPGPAGQSIMYSNPLASKFGGPARFKITAGPVGGFIPAAPVTVFAIAIPGAGPTGGNPPCTHTAITPTPFPPVFPTPACVAALIMALPTAQGGTVIGAHGGPVSTPVLSVPAPVFPAIGIGKFGAAPPGTVTFFTFTPTGMFGPTNMASSAGYPFTTGKLTIAATMAAGAPETFTITGMDFRTAGGAGVIQMVGGALSSRALSKDNANRAWVRLDLVRIFNTPSISTAGLAAAAGLMLLAVGYAVRQRRLG